MARWRHRRERVVIAGVFTGDVNAWTVPAVVAVTALLAWGLCRIVDGWRAMRPTPPSIVDELERAL